MLPPPSALLIPCVCHRYIKEIGLNDVELANMDLAEKQHKAPDFLKVI